jgi:hypothetical protein
MNPVSDAPSKTKRKIVLCVNDNQLFSQNLLIPEHFENIIFSLDVIPQNSMHQMLSNLTNIGQI